MGDSIKVWLRMFGAGSAAGLARGFVFWLFYRAEIMAQLGCRWKPAEDLPWFLYQQLVWGGIWGLMFLVKWGPQKPIQRGLAYSLIPTLVQLVYFFPMQQGADILGIRYGLATPLFVLLFNAIWGLLASSLVTESK